MKRLLVTFLAAAVSLGAMGTYAQSEQPLDRIAAVVDEDVILQSELDRALNNVLAQYANRQDQLPPRDILQRQVLERLILVKLQTADAARTGLRVSDQEVDNAINNIASQNKLTPDQLRAQLARDGMSFEDFRSSLRDEILTQRARQRFAQTRISVSESEVDAAVAAQAKGGTQYHLAHILISLPEGATPEQTATGQQKVDGIKALIDKGEMTFNAAAVRYSDSPNALEGGDLGWRSADEIPNAFASTITSLQPGQVIGPLRGPSGFQLVQLIETRQADQTASQTVTQYHARHILVRGDDDKAKAKIDTLRARIIGGADFAKTAQEDSDDTTTKTKGGDLGWFTQDQFGPEFGTQVSALQDGQVSQAFKTQAGWHIVLREGTRQTNVTDENRRAQVRESIGQRKLEDEWNRHLHELRGEAFVDIRTVGTTAPAGDATTPAPAAPAATEAAPPKSGS
ncbi:peptidylprolyl isomerase [Luteimonas panaciterrae]|uniref:peptidylprolyl isomerase n=1 Tax=Luteimonas panaciterrae TaxID=363885 RepID=UPI001CFBD942|nr:peptidylprolyl isomerase [Luteimonas panaciterrae]